MRKTKDCFIPIGLMCAICLSVFCESPDSGKRVALEESQKENVEQCVLRLMVWGGYSPINLIAKFEREVELKYGRPVKLQITEIESSDEFFDALRNKAVDLITPSHHELKDARFNYIKKGLIIPPDLENIPNYKHIAEGIRTADYHTHEGVIYGIPLASGPYALAYNADSVEEPDSWNVLWDPEYKNQYVLGANEYIYNINITAMALGYPSEWTGCYDRLNNEEVKTKLKELAVNAAGFWAGVDKAEDLKGKKLAAVWGDSFSALKVQGETWRQANPKEGTVWWVDEWALSWTLQDRPFEKKVAEEWINLTLSPEYQVDHLVREIGIRPVVTHISYRLTPEEKGFVSGITNETCVLQQVYSERDRNGLKILWKEAMGGVFLQESENGE